MIYDFIKQNLNQDSVIFEIGTHFGTDSEELIKATSCKNLHGFEPDPRNIEVIRKRNRTELFKELNACAVSNIDGTADFYLSSGEPPTYFEDEDYRSNWSASNSLKKPKHHLHAAPWCKFEHYREVNTIRVDTYCNNKSIREIDFIWMDVQGAEDLVIDGMGSMKKHIKYIYTEYSRDELYEGSLNYDQILEALGPDWMVIVAYDNDVLLKNKLYDTGESN
jgi:FkbM family methyltransferase